MAILAETVSDGPSMLARLCGASRKFPAINPANLNTQRGAMFDAWMVQIEESIRHGHRLHHRRRCAETLRRLASLAEPPRVDVDDDRVLADLHQLGHRNGLSQVATPLRCRALSTAASPTWACLRGPDCPTPAGPVASADSAHMAAARRGPDFPVFREGSDRQTLHRPIGLQNWHANSGKVLHHFKSAPFQAT
jgi:hypothetical protein